MTRRYTYLRLPLPLPLPLLLYRQVMRRAQGPETETER